MAQGFPLQTLLEVMQNRADEATRRLGQLIAAQQNAESRLQMLEQYRAEYATRLREAVEQGVTRQVLANYQEFLGRIDEAITQQRAAVQQSVSNTSAGQQHWKEQNVRLKAIDTLSVRHAEQQRKREDKLAQKLLDEFSTRKFSRSSDGD